MQGGNTQHERSAAADSAGYEPLETSYTKRVCGISASTLVRSCLILFLDSKTQKSPHACWCPQKDYPRCKKCFRQKLPFFTPVSPSLTDNSICVALDHDILLLHIFPRGFHIYCSERNERWELFDNSSKESVPNPLPPLEKIADQLQRRFQNAGITTMQFHAFAVCGDNFAEPEFHLDAKTAEQVFSTRTLAAWIKKHKAGPLSAKTITRIEEALKGWATPMKGA